MVIRPASPDETRCPDDECSVHAYRFGDEPHSEFAKPIDGCTGASSKPAGANRSTDEPDGRPQRTSDAAVSL